MAGNDIYVCIRQCLYQNKVYSPSAKKNEDRLIIVPAGWVFEHPHFKLVEQNSQEAKEPSDVTTAPQPRPMSQGTQIVSKDNRITLIISAIKELNPELDYWHGKPKVYAIEDKLKMTITKEERDAALHKMEQPGG